MEFILAFGFALFLSTVLVPFFIRYAYELKLIDEPSEARKIHTKSIPRCGGLGIVIGVLLAAVYWVESSSEYWTLGFASLIIVVFGYLDDSRNLNYRWKLLGQLIATLVLISGGINFHELPFFGLDDAPVYISYPLTLFFVLGVTNAVNLSDGLDGLAAGNSLLSLLLIAFLGLQTGNSGCTVLAVAIMGGLLGFLRYNTHPARVFMGDTGSQFLGFITASLAIMLTQADQSALNPILPLLILGLPILDTLMVMVLRTRQGRFIFSPDQNHIHHQLIKLGLHHYEVVAVLYVLQSVLVLISFFLRYESEWLILLSYGAYAGLICGLLYWGRASGWTLRNQHVGGNPKERRNQVLRKFDWYYRHSSSLLAGVTALFLFVSAFYAVVPADGLADFYLLVAILLFGVWLLSWIRWVELSTRIIVYTVGALLAYSFTFAAESRPIFNLGIDIYLLFLLLALLLAIRMTKKAVFRLDTHDYLVFALLLVVPLLPFDALSDESLARLIFRWALLIYVCEFLLSKGQADFRWLNLAGILSLVIMGTQAGI